MVFSVVSAQAGSWSCLTIKIDLTCAVLTLAIAALLNYSELLCVHCAEDVSIQMVLLHLLFMFENICEICFHIEDGVPVMDFVYVSH